MADREAQASGAGDIAMSLNQEQAKADNEELHHDAIKVQIIEALKGGPGFAKDVSERVGQPSNVVVRLLHEMEDDLEVSFSWLRGYRL